MAIDSYANLKTAIAGYYERNDLTDVLDDFIDAVEFEMTRVLKLQVDEQTAAVVATAGTGNLPTGFTSARSVYWLSDPNRVLRYVTPDELERIKASSPSFVNFYTIVGEDIKVADDQTGTLMITYTGALTPLSVSITSNTILARHPMVYLYGALTQAAIYCKDFEGASAYRKVFEAEMLQIQNDNAERKYIGQLAVRVA
jgi:hypothetical protein